MNIVEAYKKFNNQLIILISGMSGSGKSKLAENISKDFNLTIINQKDYYKKNHDEKFTLFDGTDIINWYTNDAYDWKKFNEDINNKKKDGVVVIGLSFPTSNIDFKPDFHLTISIKKQNLLEKMEKLLEENKDKYPEKYEEMKSGKMKYIFNKLSYPFYLNSIEESIVNKFINANDMDDDKIYDIAFDYLINRIDKNVHKNETLKREENILDSTDSIITETTDPLEFVEHYDKESPYEDIASIDENQDLKEIDAYEYGLKGEYIYW